MEFIGVSFDHDSEAWKKCLEEQHFEWPQVCNFIKWKENPVSEAFGIHWIPTMMLIGPDGKVVKTIIGEDPAFYTFLDELFK